MRFRAVGFTLLLACSVGIGIAAESASPEEKTARTIPLESVLTTSGQQGLKNVRDVFPEENGYLRQILEGRCGASTAFLVEAPSIIDAVSASAGVFVGSRNASTPATLNKPDPPRGTFALVAYLGSGGSEPTKWIVDKIEIGPHRIRLSYHAKQPGPETTDVHRYHYWALIDDLNPGYYNVELYDTAENAVTLMRRVEVMMPRQ
ncbi:MAG: hypothetical protein IT424_01555 [Pirellulales bacterium]|nr:hypothetical protein [Pirellulales bacterium]